MDLGLVCFLLFFFPNQTERATEQTNAPHPRRTAVPRTQDREVASRRGFLTPHWPGVLPCSNHSPALQSAQGLRRKRGRESHRPAQHGPRHQRGGDYIHAMALVAPCSPSVAQSQQRQTCQAGWTTNPDQDFSKTREQPDGDQTETFYSQGK